MSKLTSNEWLRKRKWMCINICIGTFIYGLCLSVYFQTEYLYFKNTMKVKKPELFYGLGEVIGSIGGLISSLLPVYYADKTKNVRQILFIIVSAMLLGNVFYTLYYSPYFVLFGHLLIGCCTAVEVIGYGEAVRVYNPKELTKITSFLTIFTVLGHALGPCLTFIFSLVDVRIAGWKIVAGNMPGITMAVFILFYLVLMYYMLNNVSKEFTLKDADKSTSLLEAVDKLILIITKQIILLLVLFAKPIKTVSLSKITLLMKISLLKLHSWNWKCLLKARIYHVTKPGTKEHILTNVTGYLCFVDNT